MAREKAQQAKEATDQAGLVTMQRVKLSKLKDAPYNPRTITEEAMARLERSVQEHGMVVPIVWNKRTGNVVGGHQRKLVLERRGAREADVVVVDVPLEREKAMNVALNNQFISGDWDLEKLYDLGREIGGDFAGLTQLPDFFMRDMDKLFRGVEAAGDPTVPAEFKELGIDEEKEREHAVTCPKCGHVFAR